MEYVMQHRELEEVVKRAASEAVIQTLTALGFDVDDRPGLRADLGHLRRWRVASERISARAITTAVTVIVAGLLGWLGLVLSAAFHLRGPAP